MRTIEIPIRNNQKVEILYEKYSEGFEIWGVGVVDGQRMLIDHHLTHDNIEQYLEYAAPGDLVWQEGSRQQIPNLKHAKAIELEGQTIALGVFLDYVHGKKIDQQDVTGHLAAIPFITLDIKELNRSRKLMLGKWSNGSTSFLLEEDNKIIWKCVVSDPLSLRNGHVPDWWKFAKWNLSLVSNQHGVATYVSVLRVNEHELHLTGGGHPHRMARIFQKQSAPL